MMALGEDRQDISQVVEDLLCHSCGACRGVCPEDAIRFGETVQGLLFPSIDPERCSDCGLCLAVCPGGSLGGGLMEMLPEDPFTGTGISSFVGKSTDEKVYSNSQSGGVASELLLHALRSDLISGAVVVRMEPGTRPRPEVSLASTEEEIIDAQRSKYTPVPLLEILGRIREHPGKVAVVGLSCHIHGLLKVCARIPAIREKTAYRIGLACDRSLSGLFIDYLAIKAGFGEDEEKELVFRDKSCGGFPGKVRISSPEGRRVILGRSARRRIRPYLTPPRCHMCFDKMNVLSDVTIADPHGIASADRKNGESVCIARTGPGLALVESAMSAGRVTLREIPYKDITRGQKVEKKRKAWISFCDQWISLGRPVPDYYPAVRRRSGAAGGSASGDVDTALGLLSFDDRAKLFEWLREMDRKDLFLGTLRSVYTYPVLAARRFFSILKGCGC
jgi:coenzyme F420 hydrogenase subunit beta